MPWIAAALRDFGSRPQWPLALPRPAEGLLLRTLPLFQGLFRKMWAFSRPLWPPLAASVPREIAKGKWGNRRLAKWCENVIMVRVTNSCCGGGEVVNAPRAKAATAQKSWRAANCCSCASQSPSTIYTTIRRLTLQAHLRTSHKCSTRFATDSFTHLGFCNCLQQI